MSAVPTDKIGLGEPLGRSIRVLRLIARLNVGGPASHVAWLTALLAARGYETLLVCGAVDRGEVEHEAVLSRWNVEPRRIHELGRPIRPLADAVAFFRILVLLFRFRPDVVHTHTAKAGALGRLAALLYGFLGGRGGRRLVLVHTYHGHVFEGYFGGGRTRVFLALERLFARWTDCLIVLSERLLDDLVRVYRIAPRNRFRIVPLGLDLAPLVALRADPPAPAAQGPWRERSGAPAGALLAGWVGRLVPIKDPDLLLAAARILAREDARVHFLVAGDGPLLPALEAVIQESELAHRVHLAGTVRDLASLYAELDILVLTSINEGTPLAILEAFAAGVPVVATAVGGVPDLLAQGRGILVPDRTPEALARAIARLAADSESRRAIAACARDYVVRCHGLDALAEGIDRLYREALTAPARHAVRP